jgi:hypothetical protein
MLVYSEQSVLLVSHWQLNITPHDVLGREVYNISRRETLSIVRKVKCALRRTVVTKVIGSLYFILLCLENK